jgi:tRNA nucleotidyltransferase (CCA-adding enzyme)
MLLACEADARGRKGLEDREYPQAERLRTALRAAKSVDAAQVKAERGLDGEALGKALHDERLHAVKRALAPSTAVEQEQESAVQTGVENVRPSAADVDLQVDAPADRK